MESLRIEGCFPLIPVGKQSVRSNKGGQFYIPSKTKKFMAQVAYFARGIYKGDPLEIPLSVELTFAFPNEGHRLKPKHSSEWQCQKPDLDNLEKSFVDALSGIIWKDDCWVVEKKSCKVWSNVSGIWLLVKKAGS